MRRAWLLTFGGSALLAAACPAARPDADECADACAVAARCGLLPSALGGTTEVADAALAAACAARCAASDPSDEVDTILECLGPHAAAGVCAVDACVDARECLSVLPSAVVGAAEVTFRLIDGEAWTLLFQRDQCGGFGPDDVELSDDEVAQLCGGEADPCGASAQLRLPLCSGAACDVAQSCDPRLCDDDYPASFDCAYMGIETVQFGYFDERGALYLDPAVYGCTEASEGRPVAGVTAPVIYPVALFSGRLSARVLDLVDAPDSAEGREYCWLSHPSQPLTVGFLVRAGPGLVAVPTPSSALLAATIAGDPSLFPRGCNCVIDRYGCEDMATNFNCDNGLDDDRDGLVDAEDPGCPP